MESQIKYKGYTINIIRDDYSADPLKEFDSLGEIGYISTSRYILGSKALDIKELISIEKNDREYISIPVYAYIHTGATIKASKSGNPFHCPWDSGQTGIVFVSKDKVRKEYGWKKITAERKQQIEQHLINEVVLFDHYVSGNVYGYEIEETGDSCWGFYGDDFNESGLLDDAKDAIECSLEQQCEDV